jgi:hypothetical protein
MKSAIGIGALLMDGLGDTIRWVWFGGEAGGTWEPKPWPAWGAWSI